jgi:hypothetical protein
MNECDSPGGHNALILHFMIYISPTAEFVDASHGLYRSKLFWLHVILKAFSIHQLNASLKISNYTS